MPALQYRAKAWMMSASDELTLGDERKVFRRIYGCLSIGNCMMKKQWLRSLGHVIRMDERTSALKAFVTVLSTGCRERGTQPQREGEKGPLLLIRPLFHYVLLKPHIVHVLLSSTLDFPYFRLGILKRKSVSFASGDDKVLYGKSCFSYKILFWGQSTFRPLS